MPVLTITVGEVARLASLDATADAAEITAVIADEQAAQEYAISADALARSASDAGLYALLRRGVAKMLAAEVLAARARAEGASGTIVAAGVTVSSVPDHAAQLQKEAARELKPYLKRVGHSGATSTPGPSPVSPNNQDALFGKSESGRHSGPYGCD